MLLLRGRATILCADQCSGACCGATAAAVLAVLAAALQAVLAAAALLVVLLAALEPAELAQLYCIPLEQHAGHQLVAHWLLMCCLAAQGLLVVAVAVGFAVLIADLPLIKLHIPTDHYSVLARQPNPVPIPILTEHLSSCVLRRVLLSFAYQTVLFNTPRLSGRVGGRVKLQFQV